MRNGAVLDGRYRIEQKLAAGGFGAIYRATDLIMGREVALKVLHRELSNDPAVVERFRREAGALARLRDPHTITMYDVGLSVDGTRYIVMELLRGESLYALFAREGRLPWQRVVAIARGVCSSLREAHAFQIVHRDLKPANIHLERHTLEHDYVKVLDFGIAKLLDSSDLIQQQNLTLAGQLVGTYDYMSPEQMIGGACSSRADVFALAVIIYEMIAGVRPYGADAKGPASMLMALLGTEPAPLSTLVSIPPALDRVVMMALAQDPRDRLDIDELDETLARILDTERGLALGTMDVPAGSSSVDLAAPEDDEATWIDQAPTRTTPTSLPPLGGQARITPTTAPTVIDQPPRITPTTVPTLIGTLPAMRTLPLGAPITPAHGLPIGTAGQVTPPKQVQRKTPLRGTPPPELQRRVATRPDVRGPGASKPDVRSSEARMADTRGPDARTPDARTPDARIRDARIPDARAKTEAHDTQSDDGTRDDDDPVSRGHAPTEPPRRRTPPRGTPPMPTDKPPRGGMKTSASSEEFTRIETPRGLASGTTRPPSKPVSPVAPTAAIEQAIAEEIEHAVDAMVVATVPPKVELSLPRPGSPAQAGIWPVPESIRPPTVRFAVGSGTELPSLEAAAAKVPLAVPVQVPVQPAPPITEQVGPARRSPAVRYLIWALALFGVGFAAALGISAL